MNNNLNQEQANFTEESQIIFKDKIQQSNTAHLKKNKNSKSIPLKNPPHSIVEVS